MLGGFEYFMYKAHRMGCGLIYCIASLENCPAPLLLTDDESAAAAKALLGKAALLCVKRHPNLRARIVEDDGDGEAYLEELVFEDFCERHAEDAVTVVAGGRPVVEVTGE